MLKKLIAEQASIKEIEKTLEDIHGYDLVQMFEELNEEEQKYILDNISSERLADVLSYLDLDDAVEIFKELSIDEQKEVVEELEPDDAADIINELEDVEKSELIDQLEEKEDLIALMKYDENEAGSHMNSDVFVVHIEDDVKVATKKLIKEAPNYESIKTIFVTDELGKYVGQVPLKKLIRAKHPSFVKDIYEIEPTFKDHDKVDDLVKHMKHYGGYDIAIVDDENILLGAITTDDILDIFKDEALEDFEKLTMLPDTDIEENVLKSAIHRLPWLVFLLFLSIPLAFLTSNFEEILSTVVILALFQPLILDTGGNVASQTLAVTLISFTNKEGASYKNGMKEVLTGLISGLAMGILGFVATYIFALAMSFESPILMGLVIGLSLTITIILSPIIGFMIPIFIKSIKKDPAVASGPFITTLIDILSILIYFGLATLILGGLVHV